MKKNLLLFAALFSLLIVLSFSTAQRDRKRTEIRTDYSTHIKFSHKFHVKETGIACADCHGAVDSSMKANDRLGSNHDACKSCHEEQLASTCSFCHTGDTTTAPEPLPPLDRELRFSHATHVAKNKIECLTCHAGVDSLEQPSGPVMPAMATCTGCHEQKQVSIECETCHRDVRSLIPDSHLLTDFRKDHKQMVRAGTLEVSCATCHDESFCQDCHSGSELKSFGGRGLMAEPAPRTSPSQSPKQMKIQRVHDLNYKFTHAIDAKSHVNDCASCHDRQEFCSTCHDAGGNINQTKIKPASHQQAGFTTLGKGSGGGLHATLAKRDIESCASCHDVQGGDPVCSTCHAEDGSVR